MVTVVELLQSRAIAKRGGKLTATRSFHVFDTASPITTPGQLAVLAGTNGLPVYGEEYPESPNLLARDYEFALVSGTNDLWLIRWDYAEAELGGFIQRDPGSPNYCEIGVQISAERVSAWRNLNYNQILSLVNGPYPAGDTSNPQDIGGGYADAAGEPTQQIVRQVELTINETRSGLPNLTTMISQAWTRNLTTFMGAPPGQLLYVGASVNRIDQNLFQFSHKFILDRWWHMRQMPRVDAEGRTINVSSVTTGLEHANVVVFVQGFPTRSNFFNISPNFYGVA